MYVQEVDESNLLVVCFEVECLGVRLAYRVVKGSGRLACQDWIHPEHAREPRGLARGVRT